MLSLDIYTYVCLVLFIITLRLMYNCFKQNPLMASALVPVFIIYLMVYLALFIIDHVPWYSHELEQMVYRNYAFLYFNIFTIPFLILSTKYKLTIAAITKHEVAPLKFIILYIIYLCFTIYLTGGSTRFTLLKLPFGNVIRYFSVILVFLSFYYFIVSKKKYSLIITILIALNALVGRSLQVAAIRLLSLFLIRKTLKNDGKFFKIPYFYYIIIPVIMLASIALRSLFLLGKLSIAERLYFQWNRIMEIIHYGTSISPIYTMTIFDRIIAQGNLFWVSLTSHYEGNLAPIVDKFLINFLSVRNTALSVDYGLGHFMASVSPDIGYEFAAKGITFAGGCPAIFIYYFNIYIAFIIYIALAVILLKYKELYIRTINDRKPVEFVLLSLIGAHSIETLFFMGDVTPMNMRLVFYLITYFGLRAWTSRVKSAKLAKEYLSAPPLKSY